MKDPGQLYQDLIGDMPPPKEPAPAKQDQGVPRDAGTLKDQALYLGESAKMGVAQQAELWNEGARLLLRSYMGQWTTGQQDALMPDWLKRGAAVKALGVDEARLKRGADPLTEAFAPMAAGAAAQLTMPIPGLGLVKNVMLGAGASEFGEIGKYIFQAGAETLGAARDTIESAGKVGQVVGSGITGFGNVVRYNAFGKALAAPVNVAKAATTTVQAKLSGDQRAAFEIFTDRYNDLRDGSKGVAQAKANGTLADVLNRHPDTQRELEGWDRDLAALYGDDAAGRKSADAAFALPQKTGSKTMADMALRQPQNAKEAAEVAGKLTAQKSVIADAVQRTLGKAALPMGKDALAASLELERGASVAQIDKLIQKQEQMRGSLPNHSKAEEAQAGAGLRDLYDAERGKSSGEFNQRYEDLYKQADGSGVRYDLRPALGATKEVLDPLLAKVETASVPESIHKLNSLIQSHQRRAKVAEAAGDNQPFYMRRSASPQQPPGYSFREIHDVVKAMGRDVDRLLYGSANPDYAKVAALNKVADSLLDVLNTQSKPEVTQQFQGISADYREKFVPRFKEGVNLNLHRQAGAARAGREMVPDQQVWNKYLDGSNMVDTMRQFDDLFGGRLAARNGDAYKGLGMALADRFSKNVLNERPFSRDKANAFFHDYGPALERVPQVREHLNSMAEEMNDAQIKQGVIRDQFENIVGRGTLGRTIGPAQARKFFQTVMTDPVAMQRALGSPIGNSPAKAKTMLREAMNLADPVSEGGDLQVDKLTKLMKMGQHSGGYTSFDLLLSHALGDGMVNGQLPPAAAAHKYRLQAIADLERRRKMISPQDVTLPPGKDWLKHNIGMGAGTIYTNIRNWPLFSKYIGASSAGRFFTAQWNKSMTEAMRKAMWDPAMSEDVLALMRATKDNPANRGAFEAVMGTGKASAALLKEMTDYGLVRQQINRGAAIGTARANYPDPTTADEDEKDRKRRVLNP